MERNLIVRVDARSFGLLLCFNLNDKYTFSEIRKRYDGMYPEECRKILDTAFEREPWEFGRALLNLVYSHYVFRIEKAYIISPIGIAHKKGVP